MRKVILFVAVLLFAAVPARAQDSYPTVEVFGGYSYLSVDLNIDDDLDDDFLDFDEREGFHGFGFSIAGNFHPNVGIVADLSYHKKEIELPGEDFDTSTFIFLFGPRFTGRGDTVNGFGHVLVGGTRVKAEGFDSDTGFTIGVGGGIDINVHPNVAIRLVQADYLPTRINGEWFNNFRAQIGLVFRTGE
jgi:hypothetical protein